MPSNNQIHSSRPSAKIRDGRSVQGTFSHLVDQLTHQELEILL